MLDDPDDLAILDGIQRLHAEAVSLAEAGSSSDGTARERIRALSEELLARTEDLVAPGIAVV